MQRNLFGWFNGPTPEPRIITLSQEEKKKKPGSAHFPFKVKLGLPESQNPMFKIEFSSFLLNAGTPKCFSHPNFFPSNSSQTFQDCLKKKSRIEFRVSRTSRSHRLIPNFTSSAEN